MIWLLVPLAPQEQVRRQSEKHFPDSPATVQGTVRDSSGHSLSDVTLYLQVNIGTDPLIARSDPSGRYRFLALREGVYTVRAEKDGFSSATAGPWVLGARQTKTVDLTLVPAKPSTQEGSSPSTRNEGGNEGKPEFFDEPAFTVAGVTDSSNLGGHGSNTVARSKDALARETVSLGKETLSSSSPASSPPSAANEETLRETLTKPGRSPSEEARLHHQLGDIEEKQGNSLEAVREYQRAAELDPSEVHLFDWGAELLMHHAAEPALAIFSKGNRQYPRSARMLVGLGVASYVRGSYDLAAQHLCEASDLNPDDLNPYLFIGKIQSAGSVQSDCMADRMERFARLKPENALANYYCALSLRKRRKSPDDAQALARMEALLKKAVRLDPGLGTGYLELGILYSDQKNFPQSIAAYQKAISASPGLEEAHYRLSQIYRRTGEKSKAQQELKLYDELAKKTEEENERQRHEIQQFVYTLRDQALRRK